MVDSININSGTNPIGGNPMPNQTPVNGNFYEGFAKPSQVNVNLASEGNSNQLENNSLPMTPPVEPVLPSTPSAPEAPRYSDFKPAQAPPPAMDNAYNSTSNEALNWKGILFISAIGIVVTVLFGFGSYFLAGAIYGKTLDAVNLELKTADQKLADSREVPTSLELPVVTPPSTAVTTPSTNTTQETTTPKPTPTVVETPIQTPAADVSAGQGQG